MKNGELDSLYAIVVYSFWEWKTELSDISISAKLVVAQNPFLNIRSSS